MGYKIRSSGLIYSKNQNVLSHQLHSNDLCNIIKDFSQEHNKRGQNMKILKENLIESYKTNSENNNNNVAFLMSA